MNFYKYYRLVRKKANLQHFSNSSTNSFLSTNLHLEITIVNKYKLLKVGPHTEP